MRIALASEAETIALGHRLGRMLREGDVVALYGPLGVGKTTLVRGMVQGIGSSDWVMSPSFVLLRIYRGRILLFHLDFYRLRSEEEAWEIGVEEWLPGPGATVVEWADRFPALLPPERLEVWLSFADEGRVAQVEGQGEWEKRLRRGLGP